MGKKRIVIAAQPGRKAATGFVVADSPGPGSGSSDRPGDVALRPRGPSADGAVVNASGRAKAPRAPGSPSPGRGFSALAESEARFRALFDAHVDAVLMVDAQTREIVDANAVACVMYGYPRTRLVGMSADELSADPEIPAPGVPSALDDRVGHASRLHRRRDGSTIAVQIGSGDAQLDGRPVAIVVVRDDSVLGRDLEEARRRSTHDPLTLLPNRALLTEEADRALARADCSGETLALMHVDLDGFRPVNEDHGYEVGDEVLRVVAQRLRSAVRTGDVAARIEGDEFIVLCPVVADEIAALNVAHRLARALAEPVDAGVVGLPLSACIGVVVDVGGSRGVERLLRDADAALFSAKRVRPGSVALFAGGSPIAHTV